MSVARTEERSFAGSVAACSHARVRPARAAPPPPRCGCGELRLFHQHKDSDAEHSDIAFVAMDKPWMQPISRPPPSGHMFRDGAPSSTPECGDFKRGSCFRATCKFLHNGKPASEYGTAGGGGGGGGGPGLPTPRAAGGFIAPDNLDLSLWDPNTGFGLYGTPVFGTRYGQLNAITKVENVRPLCMDFFRQGVCNRRGPHNQGCLFRHDEIEGKGKVVDTQAVASRIEPAQVEVFTVEAQGRVAESFGKLARSDVAAAAAMYAKAREAQLKAEEEAKERFEADKAAREAAANAATAAAAPAAQGGGGGDAAAASAEHATDAGPGSTAAAAAAAEAPLPPGWKVAGARRAHVLLSWATKKTSGSGRPRRTATTRRAPPRRPQQLKRAAVAALPRGGGGGGGGSTRAAACGMERGKGRRWAGVLLCAWREDALDSTHGAGRALEQQQQQQQPAPAVQASKRKAEDA